MRYQGGKCRVGPALVAYMAQHVPRPTAIVEPFVGGGNMTARLGKQWPDTLIYGGEIKPVVSRLWRALLWGWEPATDRVSREEFTEACAATDPTIDQCWRIVSGSFNGTGKSYGGQTRWFGGTKEPNQRNYVREVLNSVRRQLTHMRNVQVLTQSYESSDIHPGDLVYCDPPYAGTAGYDIPFDHRRFWDWARSFPQADVFVSEYTGPCEPVLKVPACVRIRGMQKPATECLWHFRRTL